MALDLFQLLGFRRGAKCSMGAPRGNDFLFALLGAGIYLNSARGLLDDLARRYVRILQHPGVPTQKSSQGNVTFPDARLFRTTQVPNAHSVGPDARRHTQLVSGEGAHLWAITSSSSTVSMLIADCAICVRSTSSSA